MHMSLYGVWLSWLEEEYKTPVISDHMKYPGLYYIINITLKYSTIRISSEIYDFGIKLNYGKYKPNLFLQSLKHSIAFHTLKICSDF